MLKIETVGVFSYRLTMELEEQICALDVRREIIDLVDDEYPVLGQDLELIGQVVLKIGLFEQINELEAVDMVCPERFKPRLSNLQLV